MPGRSLCCPTSPTDLEKTRPLAGPFFMFRPYAGGGRQNRPVRQTGRFSYLLRASKTSIICSANSRPASRASSGEFPAAPTSTSSDPVVAC